MRKHRAIHRGLYWLASAVCPHPDRVLPENPQRCTWEWSYPAWLEFPDEFDPRFGEGNGVFAQQRRKRTRKTSFRKLLDWWPFCAQDIWLWPEDIDLSVWVCERLELLQQLSDFTCFKAWSESPMSITDWVLFQSFFGLRLNSFQQPSCLVLRLLRRETFTPSPSFWKRLSWEEDLLLRSVNTCRYLRFWVNKVYGYDGLWVIRSTFDNVLTFFRSSGSSRDSAVSTFCRLERLSTRRHGFNGALLEWLSRRATYIWKH